MSVLATFDAAPEERRQVEAALPEVRWAHEAPDLGATVLLSMFPNRELRKVGLGWDRLQRLELVQLLTAGANHVGWSRLPRQVQVATAAGATAAPIAEYVLGAVVAWARGFQTHTEAMRAGRFVMGAPVLGLKDLRVGIIGHGGIGGATSRLLASLGCTVSAVSRHLPEGRHLAWSGTLEQTVELAQRVQVLVVALPHVKATEGLVGSQVLDALERPSLLVNVARGPVVDQEALGTWLSEDGRWAHLDVWWDYPEDGAWPDPFPDRRNVTMTPHNSSNVPGHRALMIDAAVQNVRRYLATGKAANVQEPSAYH